MGGMVNTGELLINVVTSGKPKMLTGLGQNGTIAGTGSCFYPVMDTERSRRIESTSPVTVNLVERGKPVSLLSGSYRNLHFRVPGSPHSSRVSEVDEGAPVNVDEGWTERVKCGKNASPQKLQYPNSVRPDDCSTRAGLERLPTDLCRALGGVQGVTSSLQSTLL